ncbi:MAG: hypothetical protein LC637_13720 [Xanthomonadaceae bacterium]|nr:hypothetical protein [Xanthomonadaceae bacterium]
MKDPDEQTMHNPERAMSRDRPVNALIEETDSPDSSASVVGDRSLAALINPLSFRMSLRDRAARSAARVRAHHGEVFEVSGLAEIEQALETAMQRSIKRLVIAGGDGTLQASVSYLARHLPADQLPELIVLSAGRTNYVASDVGTQQHFPATLEKILGSAPGLLQPVERATIELSHPSLGRQYGFFMAGAMVDEVIREVHQWSAGHAGWARRHHAASAVGVARVGLRALLGRHRFTLPQLDIEASDLGRLSGHCRFLVVTTLNLETSRVVPYANRGHGALRLTAIRRGARGLWWRLPGILGGRFSDEMTPPAGYLSGRADQLSVQHLASLTLDGQEFDLDPSQPLILRTGPVFRFLRP